MARQSPLFPGLGFCFFFSVSWHLDQEEHGVDPGATPALSLTAENCASGASVDSRKLFEHISGCGIRSFTESLRLKDQFHQLFI